MNLSIFFGRFLHSHRFVATASATMIVPVLFALQSQVSLPPAFVSSQPKSLSAPFFRFTTLGYWPAAVDWFWIQTLQVVGGKNFSSEMLPVTKNFYELATDLDPRFYELYEQAATLLSFYFKSADEALYFLNKGIQNISTDWTHPYTLHLLAAYLYAYEKNDWMKAKESFLSAASLPGAPPYLQGMKEWLNQKGSEKALAKRVLSMLAQQTSDELLKQEYQKRLKAYD